LLKLYEVRGKKQEIGNSRASYFLSLTSYLIFIKPQILLRLLLIKAAIVTLYLVPADENLIYSAFIVYYDCSTLEIIWQHISDGDRNAYSEAYLVLYERFYNYGSLLTDDITLVEDSIQEVLLCLWTDRDRLRTISNPDGYFYSLFRRALVKKVKASLQPVMAEEWEPEFSVDAIIIKKEASRELQQRMKAAIDTLTPRQREAIYLRFYDGLSYEEVAATLDISVKATYKIVARALLNLKEKVSLPMVSILLLLRGVL
jgi:RNA polymerase sigma factor (sigma-70 family)